MYEGALRSDVVHHVEHLVFIGTALLSWWPLLSPLPELPRLTPVGQLIYLFALSLGQFLVTALLTSRRNPSTRPTPPRLYGLSAAGDQQLGGAVMKLVGFFAYGVPFVLAFFRWYRVERPPRTRLPAVRNPRDLPEGND